VDFVECFFDFGGLAAGARFVLEGGFVPVVSVSTACSVRPAERESRRRAVGSGRSFIY
jgi:hypothetical protein